MVTSNPFSVTVSSSGYAATHYVTAAASGGGDGSLGDPWTLTEAMAQATAGNVVQVGPGIYNGTNTTSRLTPAWRPANSGTVSEPIVFVAENLASGLDQATIGSNANRTELRSGSTTMGSGCPAFGFLSVDYVRWVGIHVDENNSASRSDTGPVTVWFSNNCRIEHCSINGVDYDWGDNHCGVRIEASIGIAVSDNFIDNFNIPNSHAVGILIYDSNTLDIHHNALTNVSNGMNIKGEADAGAPYLSAPMLVHHNKITCVSANNSKAIITQAPQDNPGYFIDIYQNIIYNSRFSIRLAIISANEAVDFRWVNNTFHTASAEAGEAMCYGAAGGAGSLNGFVFANNVFYDGLSAYTLTVAGDFFSTGTWQNNYYYSIPTGTGFVYDGTAYRDFAWWQTNHEPTALSSDPLLVDFAGNDYRLSDSSQGIGSGDSPCLGDGVDILNLLGGGTSAPINCGAYILSDQSDEIGVRA